MLIIYLLHQLIEVFVLVMIYYCCFLDNIFQNNLLYQKVVFQNGHTIVTWVMPVGCIHPHIRHVVVKGMWPIWWPFALRKHSVHTERDTIKRIRVDGDMKDHTKKNFLGMNYRTWQEIVIQAFHFNDSFGVIVTKIIKFLKISTAKFLVVWRFFRPKYDF